MNRRTHLLCLGLALGSLVSPAARAEQASDLQWVTPAASAPRVSFHTFESRAAGTEVSFHLYTPRAYTAEATRRLPVVYWLHGGGGGIAGIAPLSRLFDEAIEAGRTPPFLVVFVNGMRLGMYVDWANGAAPLETIIVHELVPHIVSNWRTVATREGRVLDGFSMGGYGAARLGFRYPERFATVSMLGAGPMQETLTRTPRASRRQVEDLLRDVYGDQANFRAVSPRRYAEENAAVIAHGSRLRLVIGDQDETLDHNRAFHDHLERLGIPHDWIVLPGVGHDAPNVLNSLGDRNWAFYRAALGQPGS